MGPEELDDDDDVAATTPFLPPADRLWRHPSELAAARSLHPAPAVATLGPVTPRPAWQVALAAGLASALVVVVAVAFTGGFSARGGQVPAGQAGQSEQAGTFSTLVSVVPATDVMALAVRVRPALCHLETPSGAWGSALLLDEWHVVASARVVGDDEHVAVTLSNGRVASATVIGVDPSSDVAVVRLDQPADGVERAELGSAAALEAGEPAYAVAAPMSSEDSPVISVGAVTQLGRQVPVDGGLLRDLIATTAPLVTTSSGGVLLDRHGDVVGLTTAVPPGTEGAEGQGFAAPIDVVRDVAGDLIESGVVERSWLGIEGSDLDAAARGRLGVREGALVHGVADGGPAADAGLAADDVVVELDEQRVHGMGQLVILMAAYDPGDEVELVVERSGERLGVALTFGTR